MNGRMPLQASSMAGDGYRQSHMTAEAAGRYEALYAPGTYDDWIWEMEKAYLARVVHKHLGSRVGKIRLLDFACGTGRVLAFLESMANKATGVDVSEAMLALARQRVQRAELLCADITREDIRPDGGYDLVTAFRFFLNADGTLRGEALRAIRQVLADDGIFVANIHGNLVSLRLASFLYRRHLLGEEMNAVSLWTMKRALARHGFRVVEIAGVGWCTRRVYGLLGRRWSNWVEQQILRKVPILSYGAVNLIFVCRKTDRL